MSIRKVTICLAVILFISATVLAFTSNKRAEKKAEKEYTPTVQTVTMTAVGDCTLATDINADPNGSFKSVAESLNGDYSYFFKNVSPIFSEDDLTIVNFEGTLSNQGTRQDKQFAFRGKPEYVQILTSSSVEAAKLENVIGSVKSLGAQLVIVSIHWGEEKATAPNDTQTELAHKAIDAGADLVLGTHPHVLQGIEKYNGKYIAYSLGNFCFGGNNNPADKDTVIYRQTFTFVDGVMQEDDNMTLIPATISGHDEYNDYQPAIAEGDRKTQIENKLIEYSTPLGLSTLNFR